MLSSLWWGVALAVPAAVACMVALPAGPRGRLAFAVGWAAMVARLAVRRPEGDYVVAADPGGYVVLGLAVALVVAGLVSGPARPRGPVAGEDDEGRRSSG